MKVSPAELRALARRDPALGRALARVPPFPDYPRDGGSHRETYFHSLARSIIYQMLSGKAARTIYDRFRALTPGPRFPTAAEVLALPERTLFATGLSGTKVRAIRELALASTDGTIHLPSLGRLPDDEIVARLTTVHGIGVWTVQMFLIFRLGRLDVLPVNDMGVQEGLRRLDGLAERPGPGELRARAEPWRPLASVAAWACWRLTEIDPR